MNLHILSTQQKLGEAAATYVAHQAAQATTKRGRFMLALSGGSLPKLLCPPLVVEPFCSQIDWLPWHVFWADERCVRLTHPDSNYRLALEEFFSYVDIPGDQIYAVDVSLDPAAMAAAYQARLAQVFQPAPGQLPRFDLILLGMGEDGHTASLFPHHPLLAETERWAAPIFDSPKPPPERITLTLPLINNARQVAFVTAGAGKAEVLRQVLETKVPPGTLPAQMVQPTAGALHWFVDEAAAARLTGGVET